MITFGFKSRRSRKPLKYRKTRKPAWKGFDVRKRRMPKGKGSRFNIRTPKLIISYFQQAATKTIYYLLVIFLAIGVFYILFFSEWLQIEKIALEGNKSTDRKLLLDVVEPYLHKKRFSVFPARSIFWVPAGRIENDIEENFRRVSDVNVRRVFPNTLSIRIEEKNEVLLFCSEKGCIWVDGEGVAYNRSSYAEAASDASGVVIVQDDSRSDLEIGSTITTTDYVDFVNQLHGIFPDKLGRNISHLSTPLPSAQEIRIHTEEGWTAHLETNLELDRSLELLRRVVNNEFEKRKQDIACLEYIDLRIADKVYYKMKDGCGQSDEEEVVEEVKPAEIPPELVDEKKDKKKKDKKKKD